VHGRLEVLRVFLNGLQRLFDRHKDIEWLPFGVYSDDREGEILKRYGVRSLKFCNKYLGRKKNAGMRELLKLDWDYVLELGSDDLIDPELINIYKPLA